jgi:hypothetical protein
VIALNYVKARLHAAPTALWARNSSFSAPTQMPELPSKPQSKSTAAKYSRYENSSPPPESNSALALWEDIPHRTRSSLLCLVHPGVFTYRNANPASLK